jgi:murein lipoprotein
MRSHPFRLGALAALLALASGCASTADLEALTQRVATLEASAASHDSRLDATATRIAEVDAKANRAIQSAGAAEQSAAAAAKSADEAARRADAMFKKSVGK